MAYSGTDMYHHLHFLKEAENYRRIFIKTLNDEYAFGGSKTGERGWKASNEFFRSVEDFSYTSPSFKSFYKKIFNRYYNSFVVVIYFIFTCFLFIKKSENRCLKEI